MKGRTEASPPTRRCSGPLREDGAVAVAFRAKVNIFEHAEAASISGRKRAFVLPPAKRSDRRDRVPRNKIPRIRGGFPSKKGACSKFPRDGSPSTRRVLRRSHALQEIDALRLLIRRL